MNLIARKNFSILALAALLVSAAGCENVALIRRAAPELEGEEVVGEIVEIDAGLNQIRLRPTWDGSSPTALRTIRYENNTGVIYRGRELPANSLEVGDVVALQVWNRARGESTNLIRVQQSSRDRQLARAGAAAQRIEGTVERVDQRARIFELREPGGANTIVSLPPDARQSTVDQLERLRRGDYVLGEGRYTDRDRFVLDQLL